MSADNWRKCPICGGDMREDYEIYSEDTTVYISYSCGCRKCKRKFKFEIEKEMDLDEVINE